MLQFTVSKTYEIITYESAEIGDAEERGYVFEDEILDLRELIKELECCLELSDSHISDRTWAINHEAGHDYRTGDQTSESIFISKVNGKPVTAHQLKRLYKVAGLVK
jgi:hypothetical protein